MARKKKHMLKVLTHSDSLDIDKNIRNKLLIELLRNNNSEIIILLKEKKIIY